MSAALGQRRRASRTLYAATSSGFLGERESEDREEQVDGEGRAISAPLACAGVLACETTAPDRRPWLVREHPCQNRSSGRHTGHRSGACLDTRGADTEELNFQNLKKITRISAECEPCRGLFPLVPAASEAEVVAAW